MEHGAGVEANAAERLRCSESTYRSLVENLPDVLWQVDEAGNTVFVSSSMVRLTGYSVDESMGSAEIWVSRIHDDDVDMVRAAFASMIRSRGNGALDIEYRSRHRDGRWIWVRSRSLGARVDEGGALVVDGISSDITPQKQLEERLLQSQKLEAVGQLAGGVAHDFNNLLAVILANASSMLSDMSPVDPRREEIEEIQQAAQRGAGLTRQLLAFSRKQVTRPEIFCPNEVLNETKKMLHRLIGEDMRLILLPAATLGAINADRGQVEQAVMNLVVNARDAMPNGGEIRLATAEVDLDSTDSSVGTEAVPPGRYVEISVSDDGCGMDEATRARIFEPFFTTKGVGRGTGLGLATVYGIVNGAGGTIAVTTAPGVGSTFRLLFPRAWPAEETKDAEATPTPIGLSGLRVLFVEDETLVRAALCRVLRGTGMEVFEASNAGEALAQTAAHPGLDLVITDVVMPGQSGVDLVNELRRVRPQARALFMTGYTEHPVLREMHGHGNRELLQKPFTSDELLAAVERVLA